MTAKILSVNTHPESDTFQVTLSAATREELDVLMRQFPMIEKLTVRHVPAPVTSGTYRRKLIRAGPTSVAMTIPIDVVRGLGLVQGSAVELIWEGRTLRIEPTGEKPIESVSKVHVNGARALSFDAIRTDERSTA